MPKKYSTFIVCTLLICSASGQSDNAISFVNFGPVAFDSFWRLPDLQPYENLAFSLSPRFTHDSEDNFYFTTYLRGDIPIGGRNSFAFRVPYHYFNVDPTTADSLNMKNLVGSEFGDIDLIFNVSFLEKLLNRTFNTRISSYLTAEMHTAPTNKTNRQFTDVIKLLGTLNTVIKLTHKSKSNLIGVLTIGGGGWDDVEAPFQKHALKLSGKLQYEKQLAEQKVFGIYIGNTFLSAEGDGNKGNRFVAGLYYVHWFQLGLRFLNQSYQTVSDVYFNSLELSLMKTFN